MVFDPTQVRGDFEILHREVYGKPLVYLDTAASAQKPRVVLEKMAHFYRNDYANVHRGLHFLSTASTEAFEAARKRVASFLNAEDSSEIVFTRNATEAINLVAQSFGEMIFQEGDEIVLSLLEHHSNIVPWHFHRKKSKIVIKWAPVDENGNFLLEDFERMLSPRTRMVALTHMSNALGTITPVKEVVAIAQARGIPVLLDGSQAAVHLPVDVQEIGCDFYVFTGHKTYGPSGIGVLYGKRQHLEQMPPYQGGGEMIASVSQEDVTYADIPHKFEAGTPAIAEAVGLDAALSYLFELDLKQVFAYEARLFAEALEQLSRVEGVKMLGSPEKRGAILPFTVAGAHPHDVATLLDRLGIAIRAGTHCAMPLLNHFGCSATCRASLGLYSTQDDIERLCDGLKYIRRFFN